MSISIGRWTIHKPLIENTIFMIATHGRAWAYVALPVRLWLPDAGSSLLARLMYLAQHAQGVPAPEIRELWLGIAGLHQALRDLGDGRYILHAHDSAAAIPVGAYADMVGADQIQGMHHMLHIFIEIRAGDWIFLFHVAFRDRRRAHSCRGFGWAQIGDIPHCPPGRATRRVAFRIGRHGHQILII